MDVNLKFSHFANLRVRK